MTGGCGPGHSETEPESTSGIVTQEAPLTSCQVNHLVGGSTHQSKVVTSCMTDMKVGRMLTKVRLNFFVDAGAGK